MKLAEARDLAEYCIAELAPYLEKSMIGGSVRRKNPVCTDVDLIVIPKRTELKDMFGVFIGYEVDPGFISVVNSWEKIKGDPNGKYCQRIVKGHKVEISIAMPYNFGNLCLIRTGDAEFSHMIMKRCLKLGFEHLNGNLWNGETPIPCEEEIDFFNCLNLPYVAPENRNKNAFRKVSAR